MSLVRKKIKKIFKDIEKDNLIVIIGVVLFFGFLLLVQAKERTLIINPEENLKAEILSSAENIGDSSKGVSPISSLPCDDFSRRPIAVMLANDPATRPLSGLAEADIIFEMQVVQNSVTRLMAVFVCGDPEEIGSIRSARDSFIPLAMGLDAIYAHWGGSHFALDRLNAGIMDNINALTNPFSAFYRKPGIIAPHNGFSSVERLVNSAEGLGYRIENNFEGYAHLPEIRSQRVANGSQSLKINYSYPYNVEYRYNADKNSYLRWRAGSAEVDKKSGKQIEVKNVVVMRADSYHVEGQYNKVEVEGSGKLTVYQNGEEIVGTWSKDKKISKSKLYFYDAKGEEIKFVPGLIWVEIIEPEKSVVLNNEL